MLYLITPSFSIPQAELQHALQASESSAEAAQDALTDKEMELRELKSQKAAEQGLISKEDHEALRLSMQAEINGIMTRFNDLTRKHEKTCTEVCIVLFCVCGLMVLMLLYLLQRELWSMKTPASLCIIHKCITFPYSLSFSAFIEHSVFDY